MLQGGRVHLDITGLKSTSLFWACIIFRIPNYVWSWHRALQKSFLICTIASDTAPCWTIRPSCITVSNNITALRWCAKHLQIYIRASTQAIIRTLEGIHILSTGQSPFLVERHNLVVFFRSSVARKFTSSHQLKFHPMNSALGELQQRLEPRRTESPVQKINHTSAPSGCTGFLFPIRTAQS